MVPHQGTHLQKRRRPLTVGDWAYECIKQEQTLTRNPSKASTSNVSYPMLFQKEPYRSSVESVELRKACMRVMLMAAA